MHIQQGSHIKLLIAFLGAIACTYSLPAAYAQNPSPNISPLTPDSTLKNTKTQPSLSQTDIIDKTQLNLLETKLQALETKVNLLESQPDAPQVLPILLSGLIGGILGSIIGGLLVNHFRLKDKKNEPLPPTQDPTIQYLNATVTHISTNVKNLSRKLNKLEAAGLSNPNPETDPLPLAINPGALVELDDGSPQPKLVEIYNRDPDSLTIRGIEVAETEESISNRRLGGSQLVVFENKRPGNYLIVKEKKIDYMIPQPNLQIDEEAYSLLTILFECRNYSANYSYFQLVQPAKVLGILGGINWTLEQRGILEFVD